MPFVFCYDSAMMLDGPIISVIKVTITALIGCMGMSCGMQGWYFSRQRKISMPTRLLVTAGGLLMMMPDDLTRVIGLVILVAMFVFERIRTSKLTAAA